MSRRGITDRAFLERVIEERDRLYIGKFESIENSTVLAAAAVDRRLEGMNEFRAQLNAQAGTFITRTEIDDKLAAVNVIRGELERRLQLLEQNKLNISSHDALEKRIQVMEKHGANIDGRMVTFGIGITLLTTLITTTVSIILHFIK